MDLVVNGERKHVTADPDRLLLFVLRNELDLTGAKYGCGEGQCGACTVLLDDLPVHSCQVKMSAAAGKRITTIEGIPDGNHLHPVQQSFIDFDAMQCGYCTPGMIVSAVALLKKNTAPSDAEIKRALQGNICRCGAYSRIVAAVRKSAELIAAGQTKKQGD
jgi:aerobic-type carbon monoxide dehydrogenase small subunit (CoxS/CutS family)